MKSRLRHNAWPLLILLAAAIGFFWQSTLAGKVLLPLDDLLQWQPWAAYAPAGFSGPHNSLIADSILENYGWKKFLLDSFRNRQLPLWNPYVLGGTPFFAPGQASVFYPFTALFLILPLAHAYGYFAALHLFLAGAFSYAFLRVSGVSRSGGLVGGLAFMFSSRLVTSILWPQMIGAIVYLPLLLLLIELIVRQARSHWPVLPALAGAVILGISILAGHVEASVYVMAAMGLYALGRLSMAGTLRGAARAAACSLTLVALGVGAAAVQLLPFYEVGSQNFRSGSVTYHDVAGFALKLPQLLTFLMPDFYGNPVIHSAPYFGPKDYVEQAAYIGVLPLLLAAATLLLLIGAVRRRSSDTPPSPDAAGERRVAVVAALWLVVVISLLLAFGTPLYRVIFFLLPGFNQIHSPFRWLIPYTGAMALLAGFGFDFVRAQLTRARLPLLGLAVVTLAGFAAWQRLVVPRVQPADRPLEVRNYAIFLALIVAAAAIAWLGRRAFPLLAIALVAADLAFFGMSFNTAADASLLRVTPGSVAFLQHDQGLFRVTSYGNDKTFEANGNMLYGIQDARGYDSVILARYAKLNALLEPQDQLQYNRIKGIAQPATLDSPLLNLLNVKYVLSQQPLADPSYKQVYAGPDGRVYQNLKVLPRAFVVGDVKVAKDELAALREIDPSKTVVLDKPLTLASPAAAGEGKITTYSGRKVVITAAGPGVLVLTDNNFPGWKVTVDGQPAELLTADYTFRGVALPAGQHKVEFTFTPRSFIIGGLVSGLSVALILVLGAAAIWQRRPVRQLQATGRVTKNSLTPLTSNIVSRLISFGFSAYYFRELGVSQVGKYVVAVAIWLFMDTVIGFGLQQFVSRDVARDKSQTNRYISNGLAVRLVMSVLVGLPVLAVVEVLHRYAGFPRDTAIVLGILVAGFIPGAFSNIFSHIFDAHELMEYKAFLEVLTAIVNVSLGVTFILAGWNIVGLAAASFVSNIFTAVAFYLLISARILRPRLELDPKLLGSIVRGAYPIMLNQLLVVFFFKIDIPILGAFRGTIEAGVYGAAYKFVDAMLMIPASFVPAVFPILSRQAAGQRDALKRGYELTLKVLLLISLPVLALFEVFADDIVRIFFGEKFAASAIALRILMLFLPFSYINGLTQYVLVALDKQRAMLRFFAITAVFNVVANLALIPSFGFIAAGAVTAASEVVLLAPLYWLTARQLGSTTILAVAVRPLLAALAAGVAMFALRPMAIGAAGAIAGPIGAALAGAAMYAAVLLALRTFSEEELALVKVLFKRRRLPPEATIPI